MIGKHKYSKEVIKVKLGDLFFDETVTGLEDLFREVDKNGLEQLNKLKKIDITDVAIEKIPFVFYPGISEIDSEILFNLERYLLSCSKEMNDSNEVAITYTLEKGKYKDLAERYSLVMGGKHSVDLSADTKTMHFLQNSEPLALINIHNHPSCTTFSIDDITLLLRNQSIKLLILLSNKGDLQYLHKKPNYSHQACADALMNSFKRFTPALKKPEDIRTISFEPKQLFKIANDWLHSINKCGIDFRRVQHDEREKNDYENDKEPLQLSSKDFNTVRKHGRQPGGFFR